ncbi:ATP-binding cassette domain-containing protein [Clostridium sp. 'deep sea']|uniref:ABC transporter ATP-binding protein n=1 Tax=Clostridium sp. 'deep sea' TaxID=2779445 RepID=UPI0018966C8D|nr:ATP-binding cassette domain-containing protein [Clostridium sp. 'deep sea']QOR36050.1 ATP-binding cassette domain-containing protein [Clostridium sp. 'deep sea']
MKIELNNISKIYKGGKTALKNVNLTFASPSLVGLVGPNGAGKSTLMKLLTTNLLQSSGEIFLDGLLLGKQENKLKSSLGYLPQEFGLFEDLTVVQFLDYMAALKNFDTKTAKAEIDRVITLTNMQDKCRAKIRTLSGGQKQRVGIAQSLLGDPKLLIFDEPTVGLDPAERVAFRNLFAAAAKSRLVILSTHIIEDVQSACDQLIVLNKGELLYLGTPEELMTARRAFSLESAYMALLNGRECA